MRIRAFVVLAALLLVPATGVRAQDTPQSEPNEPNIGSVDFGGQFTSISGDEARYQRYKDLRNGPLLDAFTYTREKDDWLFTAAASHVGYRDQRYAATFRKYGRVTINFLYDQTPTNYSFADSDQFGLLSATPYRRVGDGEYRIDDGVQGTLEALCPKPPCSAAVGAARQALLYNLVNQQAQGFDIEHRRDTALIDATISLMKNTNALLYFRNTNKNGTMPWAASFGFSHAVDLPGPVDHRTTDAGAAVEYSTERAMVKVGWDGSWFVNNVSTLVWDNPLRLTDFTYGSAYSPGDGTSQGREDLWPDTAMNMISGTANYRLPKRTRVYGNLGYSKWTQDDQLLPHTINTAIPVIPLERPTADASIDVTSALVGIAGRPLDKLWFNARYKLYDYNNNTPFFPVEEYVRFDQVEEEFLLSTGGAVPFSYKRQYFDADVSYNVMPFTAVRLGFSHEGDDRTFREFESTGDNMVKVAVDTTGWKYLSLRAQYDYAKRTGEGLDEEVFDAENEGQALPRQFDISDRNRNRFTFIATVIPSSTVAISGQVGIFREDRPDAEFGLQNTDGDFYSIGVDVTPVQKVAFGLTYGNDSYKALQRSRQANPGTQQFDPTRDWTTDIDETTNTIYAYVDVLQAIPKTDIRYALDWMDGVNDITYGLRPDQTIFVAPAALRQLPELSHTITRSTLDVMYRLNRHFGVGGGWLYEDYAVDDWAWNQDIVNGLSLNPPGQGGQQIITTRYLYRPYTGNTGVVRVRYFW